MVGQIDWTADDSGSAVGEMLGFGRGAVVHRDVVAGVEEPGDQLRSHPACADPANLQG
jgi:hypothetical protein